MEWLREILDRLLSIFPRIVILTPYEAGVRFTFGKYVSPKESGWYIFWPLVQKFVWMEVQTQIVDLRNQSIRTKDNQDIIVSGAVQYSIKDIAKAVINIQNIDAAIETLSLGIILEFVKTKTLEDCQNVNILKSEIRKGLRESAKGYGVKIEDIYITDLGKTRNIRLLGSSETGK